ncbi:MAG: hypothetical protein K2X47_05835 [Bdellovibrionales bacterium]|nr:hypothetical protein [Bdellovibrionales bacterium]
MRIAVIGNIAGGKTRLSRRLAELHTIPLTHVDSIQFIQNMKVRPLSETRKILTEITDKPTWIIDGYGPLDLLEQRLRAADIIVFVDLPILRHYFWLSKRQLTNLWQKREELAETCDETSASHTIQLYRRLWAMHKKMRPQLIRLLSRDHLKSKVTYIQSVKQWDRLYKAGF